MSVDEFEEAMHEVGKRHHANGFLACVVRLGLIVLAEPTISHAQLVQRLHDEVKALPGYILTKGKTE
jgi:hypothetical protein